METSKAERLERAVATLNDLIDLTRGSHLHETAQFLAMAKLHLLMDLNGVSDAEFRALCDHLEGKTGKATRVARTRGATARNRRDAEMRLTGRAWQCRSDVTPRSGRNRARG
jgi:hypothetical protein